MDQEVKDIVKDVHDRTMKLLLDNKEGFTRIAELLLEKEVIFAEDLEKVFGPKVKASDMEEKIVEDKNEGQDE